MSSNKRKNLNTMEVDKNNEETSSSDDDDDDDGGSHPDAYKGNEEVQIDFEGRAPVDPDAQGISQLLQRLFLRAHINCNQMAELLIAQNYVGSVICQCEEDDETDDDNMVEDGTIFGITSVLNLTAKKDQPSISQLRSYLLERAGKHATEQVQQQLRELLDQEQRHVGFLINERFINIPAQISVPLLQNLQQEIDDAKAKKMKFDFGTLLLLVKFYRKEAKKGKPSEDSYTNDEEELLSERAKFSFEYSVASECDSGMAGNWLEGDSIMTPYRKLLALDANKLPQLIKDVQSYINGE
ncbi:protein BCCIP homolog [Drosophila grimshawi]|uniref:Protein BCCIP homolog n=1 Tax=Drosophila grimshawi TaxID=7222 RepID=B4JYD1_DROGR|nr:protein BCCIP homolog [Drosophila grimshawi]EDV90693.1 GH14276 [Drosophila grimshawi]